MNPIEMRLHTMTITELNELAWQIHWEKYKRNNPNADASDYEDEKECFFEEI